MALCDVHWNSEVLRKQVGMSVLLPERGAPPFATYYLLHGLSDDYTAWGRWTRIEQYVRDLPLIVVMPDGFRGFYTNNDQGPAYARYIGEELVGFVERSFPAKPRREARYIGGLSMGGYGALRVALGYPSVFASANSHSGALLRGSKADDSDYRQASAETFFPGELVRIFGKRSAGTDHDLITLAERARASGPLPRLLIDCGADDHLLTESRRFHAELDRLQVPHQYNEFPGGHDWDYWDTHVPDALRFHTA